MFLCYDSYQCFTFQITSIVVILSDEVEAISFRYWTSDLKAIACPILLALMWSIANFKFDNDPNFSGHSPAWIVIGTPSSWALIIPFKEI